eukprot:287656-Chlamydomonas_euryale.AAC.1
MPPVIDTPCTCLLPPRTPHLLLQLEQVARELLLQPLVSVVDAQLLKAVGLKLLKAVDVQYGHAVAGCGLAGVQLGVDALHDPGERGGVDRLGERVARLTRLVHVEHLRDGEKEGRGGGGHPSQTVCVCVGGCKGILTRLVHVEQLKDGDGGRWVGTSKASTGWSN